MGGLMAGWRITIDLKDIWKATEIPFFERRDEIIRRIKASEWYSDDYAALNDTLYLLSDSNDNEDFNFYWSQLYDLADWDRVWIATNF
jgi:hypothetical protein